MQNKMLSGKRGWLLGGGLFVAALVSGCVTQKVITKEEPLQSTSVLKGGSPEVLVLGDSQISVAAGPFYQDLFKNFKSICRANQVRLPNTSVNFSKVASIGVRSTGLHSWTARSGPAKGTICDVDKNFGVNAGTWDIGGAQGRKYVQIGQGSDYQFCKPNASAFEAMFAGGYYKPKLLVMAFLGNSAQRWADSRSAATNDVRATLAQIPRDTACVFMTTAPVFSKETNDVRARAQENIASAFASHGNRCTVVKGFNQNLRDKIEGNTDFFRKNPEGKVIDELHPNQGAIKHFMDENTPALCKAISQQLGRQFLN